MRGRKSPRHGTKGFAPRSADWLVLRRVATAAARIHI
jgi:hypothetical protein